MIAVKRITSWFDVVSEEIAPNPDHPSRSVLMIVAQKHGVSKCVTCSVDGVSDEALEVSRRGGYGMLHRAFSMDSLA